MNVSCMERSRWNAKTNYLIAHYITARIDVQCCQEVPSESVPRREYWRAVIKRATNAGEPRWRMHVSAAEEDGRRRVEAGG